MLKEFMTKESKNLSKHFSAMSFLCACMIVFCHSSPTNDVDSFNWWLFPSVWR